MIKNNLQQVQENIANACKRCGRDVSEVTLIAVSKTKPVSDIYEAMACGMKDFGENKVQEMTMKWETIEEPLNWHLIGHLQTNKVKYIVEHVHLIHSVDSLKLAKKISEEAVKHQVNVNILIEVNIALEESKFGATKEAAMVLVEEAAKLPNIKICGLMTVAPFTTQPEDNRVYFRNLKDLSVDITNKNIDNVDMHVLSMGMTGDYEIAIEEGATMVRVGTGIFGNRIYS